VAAAHKLLGELGHAAEVTRTAAVAAVKEGAAANRTGRRPRFTMSAEARRKMSIAAKARWAAKRGQAVAAPAKPAKVAKKKRNVSPEVRAKLAQLAKARWATAKKADRNKLGWAQYVSFLAVIPSVDLSLR
jgi:nucleoid-associated protein YgaU